MVTSRRRSNARQAGMTLVEIMVTLIISSIIAASTFMFFAGQQRIYETQTRLLNIQQNLWASMEVVARYTRASGSGMYECVRPASFASATAANGSRVQSTVPSPGPLSADLTDANRPATGVRANNATNTGQWIPPLWIVNNSAGEGTLNVLPNTDILTIAFGNRTSGTDVDAPLALNFANTSPATVITLTGVSMGSMFRQGEFVLLLVTPNWGYGTNPVVDRGCTLFQITTPNINVTSILDHASNAWNPPGNVGNMLPLGGYTGGAAGVRNFGTLNWVRFFVQQVGTGAPNLMMQQLHLTGTAADPQVMAEGIEDLQVSFACDTGGLGSPNLNAPNGQLDEGYDDPTRRLDEWWNNVPNDLLPAMNSPAFCNLPTGVRITLVSRTLAPDDLIDPAISGNGPMDVEDHRYGSTRPTDSFRRRVLTTTVYPRNNKPL
jgi:prepilin-type N-terminal cleavage/methylation domain-containing protein